VTKTTKKEFESITDKPIAVITKWLWRRKIETQPLDIKFSWRILVLFFQSEIQWFYGERSGLIEWSPWF
jgi:hypothetical protein